MIDVLLALLAALMLLWTLLGPVGVLLVVGVSVLCGAIVLTLGK